MPVRRTLSLAGAGLAVVCLVAGFAANSAGLALAAGISTGLMWLLGYKRPASWPPSVALVIAVIWGAAGVLSDAQPGLMILSTMLALAGWDLMLLDQALSGSINSADQTIRLFEQQHYQSLGLALGLGGLIILAGQLIQIEIPLGGMIVLVVIAVVSLERIWHALRA